MMHGYKNIKFIGHIFSKRWQLSYYVPIAHNRFQITPFDINQ